MLHIASISALLRSDATGGSGYDVVILPPHVVFLQHIGEQSPTNMRLVTAPERGCDGLSCALSPWWNIDCSPKIVLSSSPKLGEVPRRGEGV